MSIEAPFRGIAGVRGYGVLNGKGQAVCGVRADVVAGELGAGAVHARGAFSNIGKALGLGDVTVVTLRAGSGGWVVGWHENHVIAVDLEPTAEVANVEATVQSGAWLEVVECEIDDADIEYVSERGGALSDPVADPSRGASATLAPVNRQAAPAQNPTGVSRQRSVSAVVRSESSLRGSEGGSRKNGCTGS